MILSHLDRAWHQFWKNKQLLILTIVIDFLFIFALVQIHYKLFLPASEQALRASEVMAQEMEKLPTSEIPDLNSLLVQNQEFVTAYNQLLKLIGLFFLLAFVAWLVLKSVAWFLSHKSVMLKLDPKLFFVKFILLSLFWFVVLILFLSGLVGLTNYSSLAVLPLLGTTTANVLSWALFLAVGYFAQLSLCFIPVTGTFKKTFVLGWKHAAVLVPAYVFNILLLFVTFSLLISAAKFHIAASMVVLLILTLPGLHFARIQLITAIAKK